MAGATRLELAAFCVTGRRSNQLNYAPACHILFAVKQYVSTTKTAGFFVKCKSIEICSDNNLLFISPIPKLKLFIVFYCIKLIETNTQKPYLSFTIPVMDKKLFTIMIDNISVIGVMC